MKRINPSSPPKSSIALQAAETIGSMVSRGTKSGFKPRTAVAKKEVKKPEERPRKQIAEKPKAAERPKPAAKPKKTEKPKSATPKPRKPTTREPKGPEDKFKKIEKEYYSQRPKLEKPVRLN